MTEQETAQLTREIEEKYPHMVWQIPDFGQLRIQYAIGEGAKTYEQISDIALNAPLRKPNTYAIQAAKENMAEYLDAMGGPELLQYHDQILTMIINYHSSMLYAWVRDLEKKIAAGYTIPRVTVETREALASEMHHAIPAGFDWDTIASFLVDDTLAQGQGIEIMQEHGPAAMAYRKVSCSACRHLYTQSDGKPKLHRIDELVNNSMPSIPERTEIEPSGLSYPVCGPCHVECQGSPPYRYTGYEQWAKK